LENLNSGFKNSRKKIEKQVYQKLELALAKKLNFVVNKSAKDEELLSVQKALQLTPPVNNFGDIENARQYGIMLYTRANYTSQTDPKTGWRKTIYLKK
jgi:CRISPR-associated protein Cpf1